MASYTYSTQPATQSGSGTYGAIAGATELPDVYSELSNVYPSLSTSNQAASDTVLSQLQGKLSDSTVNAIQDAAAKYGITSGMPGSGISRNLSLKDIGLTSENLQNQGLTNYGNLLNSISKTQTTSPETQIGLSQSNAALAAEANPEAATTYAQSLFDKYLNKLSGAGSSTTGSGGVTFRTNAGGGGTTTPFTIGDVSAPTVSLSQPTTTTTPSTGGNYNITGNTYGSYDASADPNATSSGSMYTGTTDNYDWESLLSEYGL